MRRARTPGYFAIGPACLCDVLVKEEGGLPDLVSAADKKGAVRNFNGRMFGAADGIYPKNRIAVEGGATANTSCDFRPHADARARMREFRDHYGLLGDGASGYCSDGAGGPSEMSIAPNFMREKELDANSLILATDDAGNYEPAQAAARSAGELVNRTRV